jgi:hypothetical protein
MPIPGDISVISNPHIFYFWTTKNSPCLGHLFLYYINLALKGTENGKRGGYKSEVSIDRPLYTLYFRQFLIFFKDPGPLNSKNVLSKYKTSGTYRTINSASDKVKEILEIKN